MDRFVIEEPGKEQPEQIGRNRGNRALGRQILAVEMIDPADTRVGSQELVAQMGHRHIVHEPKYPAGTGERQAGRKRKGRSSTLRLSGDSSELTWQTPSSRGRHPSWDEVPCRLFPVSPGPLC